MERTSICFFLGANTPTGFCGYMPQSYDARAGWRVYIIKAGPGTGKSTFMRHILQRVLETDSNAAAEEIYCSSDPDSLDGVIFHTHKIAVFDGTAPHVLEPQYWGACESVVDLGGCADTDYLQAHAADIIAATDACRERHAQCREFLAAASAMLRNSRNTVRPFIDTDKVHRTAERIAAREFGKGGVASEQNRFLSAVTPEGEMVFYSTLKALCPRLYVIEDEYGAAGALLLARLRELALSAGEQLITCRCPLSPNDKIEHLLFPRTGLGFTLSNPWHRADFPVWRHIHVSRFGDEEKIRSVRQRLAFNRRAAREMILEATDAAKEAKAIHDRMESYSSAAMDFKAADALCDKVTQQIIKQIKTTEK